MPRRWGFWRSWWGWHKLFNLYIYVMKALKIIISIFLTISFESAIGQQLNKVEREYFILGTLNDYMGRYLDPRDKSLIDRYDALQGPLITAIDSILEKDYANSSYKVDRYFDSNGDLISAKIFSDTVFTKINAYYSFRESGSSTSDNDPQLNNKPILMGTLKKDIFNNASEKLAFLAGAYVRYGLPNDTAYLINIGNSLSKATMCFQLLQEFDCKPSYNILHNIPTIHQVYFHPSNKVKTYLEQCMYLRKRLYDAELLWIEKITNAAKH